MTEAMPELPAEAAALLSARGAHACLDSETLVALARAEGIERLSLETGTSAEFAPAMRLYQRYGFAPGAAFADYANGPHNQCYHLPLTE